MFKRRTPRTYFRIVADFLWPRTGWARAVSYIRLRLQRLPDTPHKIARGIGVGVFVCFTPLFGFHFLLSMMVAYLLRANVLAAVLSTFFGNPLTFPLIASLSLELGTLMLGTELDMPLNQVFSAFTNASVETWLNLISPFTGQTAEWGDLSLFFWNVFWPYLIGGLAPGIVAGVIAYRLSLPAIAAFKSRRRKKMREKFEKMKKMRAAPADGKKHSG